MSRVGLILARLCLVIAGYACAALAASAVLHAALFALAGFGSAGVPVVVAGSVTVSIPFVALFVAYFAFLPGAVAIGVAELAGRRDWLTHALAGGATAAAVTLMFRSARPDDLSGGSGMPVAAGQGVGDPQLVGALLVAGLAGGLAYWLVAGRSAGGWRRARPAAPPAP